MILAQLGSILLGVAAVISALGSWRSTRANRDAIGEVHTLVNDRSNKQDARIEQLTATATHAGVEVPPFREP
jgi:hypothetical protein